MVYDRRWHIASIFIIFGVSGIGVLIPVISRFAPSFGIHPRIVTFGLFRIREGTAFSFALTHAIGFLGKSFGIGVIVATAFIHMLQPAFEKLTSPCLGGVWKEKYPAFAALFAMIAIIAMHLIEYVATAHMEHRLLSHSEAPPSIQSTVVVNESIPSQGSDKDEDVVEDSTNMRCSEKQMQDNLSDAKRWLSTVMLEMGILTHSVIIGVTLGVAAQQEFVGLLIALCFHQFFEGNNRERAPNHGRRRTLILTARGETVKDLL